MMRRVQLSCSTFWVDVRVAIIDGRWVASADTPDGPTLGLGWHPIEAIAEALAPFDEVVDELLESVPDYFSWR
jgi:hypothetical protein